MNIKQSKECYTVGLFEDNPIIAMGLSSYFENVSDFSLELLFFESDPKKFLSQCKSQEPDILIIDIISDQTFGLELFEKIVAQQEEVNVIAYTNVKSKQIIKSLLALGVVGYIPKREDLSLFDDALKTILVEKKVYLPSYLSNLFKEKNSAIILTDMEKKIIPFLLNGYSSKKIADEFFVTTNAIDFHRKNLFTKFQVNNIASFVKEAISQGYSKGINF